MRCIPFAEKVHPKKEFLCRLHEIRRGQMLLEEKTPNSQWRSLPMVEFKEMPYDEKVTGILGYTKMVEDFAPQLVKKELGE